jgi:CRP-like cAMP-binding protein
VSGKENSLDPIRRRILQIFEKEADEITIFHFLDRNEIDHVAGYFELADYPPGAVVFKEGETVTFLGILANGKLEANHRPTIGNKPIVIAHLGDGAHIGGISFPGGRPAMASLVAEEQSEILVISEEKFDAFADSYPATAVKILKGIIEVLTIRLESAIDRVILFH